MKSMQAILSAGLLVALVVFAQVRADDKEEGKGEGGGKGKAQPTLGLLEAVDAAGKTLTLRVGKIRSTLALAEKLDVKIDDKAAKLDDLKVGMTVRLTLSDDKKTITGVEAGEKIVLGGKAEGKEAPAPKRPEGKEAPAPKRPEGKEAPAPKRPEGGKG